MTGDTGRCRTHLPGARRAGRGRRFIPWGMRHRACLPAIGAEASEFLTGVPGVLG